MRNSDDDEIPDIEDLDDDNDGVLDINDDYPIVSSMHLTLRTSGEGSGTINIVNSEINCTNECEAQLIANSEYSILGIPAQGSVSLGWGGSESLACANGSGPNICNDIALSGYVVAQINFDLDTDLDGEGDSIDPDDDNDGIPDAYELVNGLNTLLNTDAALDRDNDGLTNLEEYLAGTDPNNPDTDGDGTPDGQDSEPTNPEVGGTSALDVASDFNGDGKADILWRNIDSGVNQLWLMDGTTRSGVAGLATLSDKAWTVTGTGNFNDDNSPDILFHHSSSGQSHVMADGWVES